MLRAAVEAFSACPTHPQAMATSYAASRVGKAPAPDRICPLAPTFLLESLGMGSTASLILSSYPSDAMHTISAFLPIPLYVEMEFFSVHSVSSPDSCLLKP